MASKLTCPHCDARQEVDPEVPPDELKCERCGKGPIETAIAARPVRRSIRRDDEDDDLDDDYPPPELARIPGTVIAAGIIWVVFGSLSVLGSIFQLIVNADVHGGAPIAVSTPICGLLFGGVFILVGVQSIGGTARGVRGNGIGSLLFGGLYTAVGVVSFFFSEKSYAIVGVFALFLALVLYLAGTLALIAEGDYKAYRRTLSRRRR
jgi:hypothetical protein